MAIEVRTVFIAKTTVITYVYVKDEYEVLTDASSVLMTIIDPDGTTQVDGEAMTKQSTGIYTYDYKTTIDTQKGLWRQQVEVIDGTGVEARTSMDSHSFWIT